MACKIVIRDPGLKRLVSKKSATTPDDVIELLKLIMERKLTGMSVTITGDTTTDLQVKVKQARQDGDVEEVVEEIKNIKKIAEDIGQDIEIIVNQSKYPSLHKKLARIAFKKKVGPEEDEDLKKIDAEIELLFGRAMLTDNQYSRLKRYIDQIRGELTITLEEFANIPFVEIYGHEDEVEAVYYIDPESLPETSSHKETVVELLLENLIEVSGKKAILTNKGTVQLLEKNEAGNWIAVLNSGKPLFTPGIDVFYYTGENLNSSLITETDNNFLVNESIVTRNRKLLNSVNLEDIDLETGPTLPWTEEGSVYVEIGTGVSVRANTIHLDNLKQAGIKKATAFISEDRKEILRNGTVVKHVLENGKIEYKEVPVTRVVTKDFNSQLDIVLKTRVARRPKMIGEFSIFNYSYVTIKEGGNYDIQTIFQVYPELLTLEDSQLAVRVEEILKSDFDFYYDPAYYDDSFKEYLGEIPSSVSLDILAYLDRKTFVENFKNPFLQNLFIFRKAKQLADASTKTLRVPLSDLGISLEKELYAKIESENASFETLLADKPDNFTVGGEHLIFSGTEMNKEDSRFNNLISKITKEVSKRKNVKQDENLIKEKLESLVNKVPAKHRKGFLTVYITEKGELAVFAIKNKYINNLADVRGSFEKYAKNLSETIKGLSTSNSVAFMIFFAKMSNNYAYMNLFRSVLEQSFKAYGMPAATTKETVDRIKKLQKEFRKYKDNPYTSEQAAEIYKDLLPIEELENLGNLDLIELIVNWIDGDVRDYLRVFSDGGIEEYSKSTDKLLASFKDKLDSGYINTPLNETAIFSERLQPPFTIQIELDGNKIYIPLRLGYSKGKWMFEGYGQVQGKTTFKVAGVTFDPKDNNSKFKVQIPVGELFADGELVSINMIEFKNTILEHIKQVFNNRNSVNIKNLSSAGLKLAQDKYDSLFVGRDVTNTGFFSIIHNNDASKPIPENLVSNFRSAVPNIRLKQSGQAETYTEPEKVPPPVEGQPSELPTPGNDDLYRLEKTENETAISKEEIQKALSRIFKNRVELKEMSELVHNLSKNPLGAVIDNAIYLDENPTINTFYHEAFHVVFNGLFTSEERAMAIEEIKRTTTPPTQETLIGFAIERGIDLTNALNKWYEEKLAERFGTYKTNKGILFGISEFLKRAFRTIYNFVTNSKRLSESQIFHRIDRGYYAGRSFVKNGEVNFRVLQIEEETDDGTLPKRSLSAQEFEKVSKLVYVGLMEESPAILSAYLRGKPGDLMQAKNGNSYPVVHMVKAAMKNYLGKLSNTNDINLIKTWDAIKPENVWKDKNLEEIKEYLIQEGAYIPKNVKIDVREVNTILKDSGEIAEEVPITVVPINEITYLTPELDEEAKEETKETATENYNQSKEQINLEDSFSPALRHWLKFSFIHKEVVTPSGTFLVKVPIRQNEIIRALIKINSSIDEPMYDTLKLWANLNEDVKDFLTLAEREFVFVDGIPTKNENYWYTIEANLKIEHNEYISVNLKDAVTVDEKDSKAYYGVSYDAQADLWKNYPMVSDVKIESLIGSKRNHQDEIDKIVGKAQYLKVKGTNNLDLEYVNELYDYLRGIGLEISLEYVFYSIAYKANSDELKYFRGAILPFDFKLASIQKGKGGNFGNAVNIFAANADLDVSIPIASITDEKGNKRNTKVRSGYVFKRFRRLQLPEGHLFYNKLRNRQLHVSNTLNTRFSGNNEAVENKRQFDGFSASNYLKYMGFLFLEQKEIVEDKKLKYRTARMSIVQIEASRTNYIVEVPVFDYYNAEAGIIGKEAFTELFKMLEEERTAIVNNHNRFIKDGKYVAASRRGVYSGYNDSIKGRGFNFYIFKEILSEGLKKDLITLGKEELTESLKGRVIKELNAYFTEQVNALKKIYEKEKIYLPSVPRQSEWKTAKDTRTVGSELNVKSRYFDKTEITVDGETKFRKTLNDTYYYDYTLNSFINRVRLQQLMFGNLAKAFKDPGVTLVKRAKSFGATGLEAGAYKYEEWEDSLGVIIEHPSGLYTMIPVDSRQEMEQFINELGFPDIKQFLSEVTYKKGKITYDEDTFQVTGAVERTDGQSAHSPMHRLQMYKKFGKMDKDIFKQWWYEYTGGIQNMIGDTSDLIKHNLKNAKSGASLGGIKTIAAGVIGDDFVYHKMSEMMLTKGLCAVYDPKDKPILDRLYTNIQQILFPEVSSESGKKDYDLKFNLTEEEKQRILRIQKEIWSYYEPIPGQEYVFNKLKKLETEDIDQGVHLSASKTVQRKGIINAPEGFKYLQQEIPSNKGKIIAGTQAMELIFRNQNEDLEVVYEGKVMKISEIKAKYLDIISNIIQNNQNAIRQIVGEVKLDRDGFVNANSGITEQNIKLFSKLLVESLKNSKASPSVIEMFEANGKEFKSRPDLPTVYWTFLNAYMAVFNRSFQIRVKGDSYVIVSDKYYTAAYLDDRNTNIPLEDRVQYKGKLKFRPLEVTTRTIEVEREVKKGKKTIKQLVQTIQEVHECVIPIQFAELMGLKQGDVILPEMLNYWFGYRIPTEDKKSMKIFKIVDFLSPSYGSTIITTGISIIEDGHDHDVDKQFIQIPNFYETNGNVKLFGEYLNNPDLTPTQKHDIVITEIIESYKRDSIIKSIIRDNIDSDLTIIDLKERKQNLNKLLESLFPVLKDLTKISKLFNKPNKVINFKKIEIQEIIDGLLKGLQANPAFSGLTIPDVILDRLKWLGIALKDQQDLIFEGILKENKIVTSEIIKATFEKSISYKASVEAFNHARSLIIRDLLEQYSRIEPNVTLEAIEAYFEDTNLNEEIEKREEQVVKDTINSTLYINLNTETNLEILHAKNQLASQNEMLAYQKLLFSNENTRKDQRGTTSTAPLEDMRDILLAFSERTQKINPFTDLGQMFFFLANMQSKDNVGIFASGNKNQSFGDKYKIRINDSALVSPSLGVILEDGELLSYKFNKFHATEDEKFKIRTIHEDFLDKFSDFLETLQIEDRKLYESFYYLTAEEAGSLFLSGATDAPKLDIGYPLNINEFTAPAISVMSQLRIPYPIILGIVTHPLVKDYISFKYSGEKDPLTAALNLHKIPKGEYNRKFLISQFTVKDIFSWEIKNKEFKIIEDQQMNALRVLYLFEEFASKSIHFKDITLMTSLSKGVPSDIEKEYDYIDFITKYHLEDMFGLKPANSKVVTMFNKDDIRNAMTKEKHAFKVLDLYLNYTIPGIQKFTSESIPFFRSTMRKLKPTVPRLSVANRRVLFAQYYQMLTRMDYIAKKEQFRYDDHIELYFKALKDQVKSVRSRIKGGQTVARLDITDTVTDSMSLKILDALEGNSFLKLGFRKDQILYNSFESVSGDLKDNYKTDLEALYNTNYTIKLKLVLNENRGEYKDVTVKISDMVQMLFNKNISKFGLIKRQGSIVDLFPNVLLERANSKLFQVSQTNSPVLQELLSDFFIAEAGRLRKDTKTKRSEYMKTSFFPDYNGEPIVILPGTNTHPEGSYVPRKLRNRIDGYYKVYHYNGFTILALLEIPENYTSKHDYNYLKSLNLSQSNELVAVEGQEEDESVILAREERRILTEILKDSIQISPVISKGLTDHKAEVRPIYLELEGNQYIIQREKPRDDKKDEKPYLYDIYHISPVTDQTQYIKEVKMIPFFDKVLEDIFNMSLEVLETDSPKVQGVKLEIVDKYKDFLKNESDFRNYLKAVIEKSGGAILDEMIQQIPSGLPSKETDIKDINMTAINTYIDIINSTIDNLDISEKYLGLTQNLQVFLGKFTGVKSFFEKKYGDLTASLLAQRGINKIHIEAIQQILNAKRYIDLLDKEQVRSKEPLDITDVITKYTLEQHRTLIKPC